MTVLANIPLGVTGGTLLGLATNDIRAVEHPLPGTRWTADLAGKSDEAFLFSSVGAVLLCIDLAVYVVALIIWSVQLSNYHPTAARAGRVENGLLSWDL